MSLGAAPSIPRGSPLLEAPTGRRRAAAPVQLAVRPVEAVGPGRRDLIGTSESADSDARPGPGMVAALQPRAHQYARIAAGARRGDRGADPVPPFSGAVRSPGTARTTSAAAYDEYLRGLTFANQRTPATTGRQSSTMNARRRLIQITRWPGRSTFTTSISSICPSIPNGIRTDRIHDLKRSWSAVVLRAR
jgi:hypothetical protein